MTRIWAQNSAVHGIGPASGTNPPASRIAFLNRDRLGITEHDPGADMNPRRCQHDAHKDEQHRRAGPPTGSRARRTARPPVPRRSRLAASSTHARHGHRHEEDRRGLDRVRRTDQQTGQEQPFRAHPSMRDPDDRERCGGGQERGGRIGRDRAHHGTPLGDQAEASGDGHDDERIGRDRREQPRNQPGRAERHQQRHEPQQAERRCPVAGAGAAPCWKMVGSVPPGCMRERGSRTRAGPGVARPAARSTAAAPT